MRTINYIVVHCTATLPGTKVNAIRNYWKNTLGWRNPGYHYIIDAKGSITQLQDEQKIANGVKGYNAGSIHVSYIGGINNNGRAEDTRTPEQQLAMLKLLLNIKARYPDAIILGHKDFPGVRKECPCFDVREWLKLNIAA